MTAPPYTPRPPGGRQRGRMFVNKSGLISDSLLSSKAFSMGERAGLSDGGRRRVDIFESRLSLTSKMWNRGARLAPVTKMGKESRQRQCWS